VTSSDPAALTVFGGGVYILPGTTSSSVMVSGMSSSPDVTLTATMNGLSLTSHVRVVGPSEVPVIAGLSPAIAPLQLHGTQTCTVSLDIPAPPGGTGILLAVSPVNAGFLPAMVTVPAGSTTASFSYFDAGTGANAAVIATLGESTATAFVTLVP